MKVKFLFGAMVSGLLGASVWISGALAQTDPLPSWNDGANKQAIVEFVEAVTSGLGADDESRNVHQEQQGDVEGVAQVHKACSLV